MSKYQFHASDIYLSGTDTPRNRLGITDPELLHEVEETLLRQAGHQMLYKIILQGLSKLDATT